MSGQMLLSGQIARNARKHPEKVALIDKSGSTTYIQLEERSNQISHALVELGIKPGAKIAFVASASRAWVEAFTGILKAGATAVPLNYRETPEQISMMLEDSAAQLLFVSKHHLETYHDVFSALSIPVIHLEALTDFYIGHEIYPLNLEVNSQEPAVMLYTGGTTGRSKGVLLSHENLFWNSLNEIIDTGMVEDDNTLIATPLHHSAALNCWLLPHLYLGATITILEKYDTGDVIAAIAREKVTNTFMPPSLAREFILHPASSVSDLTSFTRWYVGSGILTQADRNAMKEKIPGVKILYQYGLTEAGPIATVLKDHEYDLAPGSIGKPFRNVEVDIVDETGKSLPPGEIGEIVLRGPTIMLGYHNRPEANEEVLSEDGWLHTGDLAHRDANGYLYFYDRLKDMIKTGGLNVYSQEVESVIAKHPKVREVAIIGLSNERWGEEVTAIIVLNNDCTCSAEEISLHARETLASYQIPKQVKFIPYEEMPFNHNGKIMKRELRQRFEKA